MDEVVIQIPSLQAMLCVMVRDCSFLNLVSQTNVSCCSLGSEQKSRRGGELFSMNTTGKTTHVVQWKKDLF